MIIVMTDTATENQTRYIIERLEQEGLTVHRSALERFTVLGVLDEAVDADANLISILPGVHSVYAPTACQRSEGTPNDFEDYLTTLKLTARERELVQLLLRGYSNKEIATRWNITEWTVRDHVKSIYSKLGIHKRAALVAHLLRLEARASSTSS